MKVGKLCCPYCYSSNLKQEMSVFMPINEPPQLDHISILSSGELLDYCWCDSCGAQLLLDEMITAEEADLKIRIKEGDDATHV
jgi:hypothetical protein